MANLENFGRRNTGEWSVIHTFLLALKIALILLLCLKILILLKNADILQRKC